MRLNLDKKEMKVFVNESGGLIAATSRIKDQLKCSQSKAEKIAAGRYPSRLSELEQIALAQLLRRPLKAVFQSAS